jgi:hypothetical protein
MKTAFQLVAVSALACIFSSCASRPPGEAFFVRQKIPIEIQVGKSATIEIRSFGGGRENRVAIRCSPEVWNALTNGTKTIAVQLVSSNKATQISGILLGSGPIESLHYLFSIWGIIMPGLPCRSPFRMRQKALLTPTLLSTERFGTLTFEGISDAGSSYARYQAARKCLPRAKGWTPSSRVLILCHPYSRYENTFDRDRQRHAIDKSPGR